ncbi:MAG: DUF501 domain-containing protein [Bifidobacterium sp.]|nr:DUF501 domain-containing protein [Bifidobacterium sp.]
MSEHEDIERQARERLAQVMEEPATEADIAVVQRQLGRYPRGMVAVGARCACGAPLAVVTRPIVDGKVPFPTTFYLTGPEVVKGASHLEADGVMREYQAMLAQDPALQAAYARAHESFLAFRHALAERMGDSEEHIEGTSAGGMPVRVKCLHALVAHSLVMGPGVNPIGDLALERMRAEFDPATCRCAAPGAAPAATEEQGK